MPLEQFKQGHFNPRHFNQAHFQERVSIAAIEHIRIRHLGQGHFSAEHFGTVVGADIAIAAIEHIRLGHMSQAHFKAFHFGIALETAPARTLSVGTARRKRRSKEEMRILRQLLVREDEELIAIIISLVGSGEFD